MKKLIMLAAMSGIVLGCFGCPPGQCGEYHKLQSSGEKSFIVIHSCTGSWRASLLEAVITNRIGFVQELLAAGARDNNLAAYNYAVEHGYAEIAQIIKESEEKYGIKVPTDSSALESSADDMEKALRNIFYPYTGYSSLREGLEIGFNLNMDIEYFENVFANFPDEKLSSEEMHNFIERAKQLENPIAQLIERHQ